MKIEVTQDDIEKGGAANAYGCPIARAVNRVCGTGNAAVTYGYIRVHGDKLKVPLIAQKFLSAFDKNEPVQPFSFEL